MLDSLTPSDWQPLARCTNEFQRRLIDSLLAKGTINPFRRYAPRGAPMEAITGTVGEMAISGPAGTGKSLSCMVKLNYCALHYSGFRGLMLRKVRASLTDTGLVTFERDVLGLDHPFVVDGPSRPHRWAYHYPGGEIVVGGLDNPSKVLSSEYDLIYVQQAEEVAEGEWELLTTRLRNNRLPFQQIIGCCNPDRPTHWLRARANARRLTMLESRHEDNPTLWDAATKSLTPGGKVYIARLDALTGVRKARLRYGQWVQAEGMVYEAWDRAIHLIPASVMPEMKRVIAGTDWGYVSPGVIQIWAIDGDGRMYRVHEVYQTKRLIDWWTGKAQELRERFKVEVFVCDPSEPGFIAQFREAGLNAVAADNDVHLGIQAVQQRLALAGDGKPRLFMVEGALGERDAALAEEKKPTCTEEEIDGYSWAQGVGQAVKEVPVKVDDHGMDTTRYVALYLEGKASVPLLLWGGSEEEEDEELNWARRAWQDR